MRIGSVEFSPSRWPTLVTLVLFGFLLALGFWQLDRAEQKREIVNQYRGDKNGVVIRLNAGMRSAGDLEYQRASSVGHYDSAHQLLLDNRVHEGQAGYQVLTPFILRNSDVAVLVNRNTGSAAEMLAMALRDNGRGTLVGERTDGALYGKDGVDLPDGRMVVFRCEPTILSPSKSNYAVRGIPPHKAIDASQSSKDVVIQEALKAVRPARQNSQ